MILTNLFVIPTGWAKKVRPFIVAITLSTADKFRNFWYTIENLQLGTQS